MGSLTEKKAEQTVTLDGSRLQFRLGEKKKTFYNYKKDM